MRDVNTWKLNAQEIKHLDIQTTRLHVRLMKIKVLARQASKQSSKDIQNKDCLGD